MFNLLVSDRWQAEMMGMVDHTHSPTHTHTSHPTPPTEGIFDTVNAERDKQDMKDKGVKKGVACMSHLVHHLT